VQLSTPKGEPDSEEIMNLDTLVEHLDRLLRIREIPDYPTALNGLQLQNSGTVDSAVSAVDLSEATIRAAVDASANLILVHHGMFWDGLGRLVDRRYRRLKLLMENDIAVYSAHLPLDVHPQLGNNVLLAQAIGLSIDGSFGNHQGMPVGVWGHANTTREELAATLETALAGPVRVVAGGNEKIKSIGVITGGAASMIGDAVELRLDACVTGEGAHHTYFDAMENGINVYYGGHYATETFGVRALANHLSKEFNLRTTFIDLPTGF